MPKKSPFRLWLGKNKMTVPEFVAEAINRGVSVAKQNTAYNWARGSKPRNQVLFEEVFPDIKF